MNYVLPFILFFFTLISKGQTFDLNKGNFVNNEYFIEIPFQNIKDKIVIDVEVGGKKRKFILDTGAPLVISRALFEELNCKVLSKQEITDINQKKDSAIFVNVDSLKIGNYYLVGVPAIVSTNNLIMDCFKVDGFIGSNVLRNSVIQFDSQNETIRITNDISKLNLDLLSGNDLMLDQQSSPYLKFNIGKKISEFALFDSGSDEFYSMANGKIEKFIKAKDFKIISKAYGSNTLGMAGIANSEETSLLFIPFVTLNGVKIDNVISESSNDINSRIGSKILGYGKLTIDYKNKKYFYANYANRNEFENNQLQISLNYSENNLCIGKIWTKELEKKVKVGEKIVSINGVNVENITICEAIINPRLKENSKFGIEIKKNNGEIVSLEIDKIKWE